MWIRMTVWKRLADVTYPPPIPFAVELNNVGNLSPGPVSSDKVPAHVYLDLYTAVFPKADTILSRINGCVMEQIVKQYPEMKCLEACAQSNLNLLPFPL